MQIGDISKEHWKHLHDVRVLVNKMPNCLTCHGVARMVSARMVSEETGLRLVRGTFANLEHSWLEIDSMTIIDPYPWACASGPILVTLQGLSPWKHLYVEHIQVKGDLAEPNL